MDKREREAREVLKPCPFCGGEAAVRDDRLRFVVECEKCQLIGPLPRWHGEYDDEDAPPPSDEVVGAWRQNAIAAWNTRPAADLEAVKEACAKVADKAAAQQEEEGEGGGREWSTAKSIATAIRSLDLSALSCAGEG